MTPLALESGWAVAGGLIPMIGLGGLALILWRAVKEPPEEEPRGERPPPEQAAAEPPESQER